MQNINPRVSELFHKYMDGQLTEAERQEFLDYADDPSFHREINDLLGIAFENQTVLTDVDELGRRRLLDKVFMNEQIPAVTRKVRLWPRIGIAAAVATLIVSVGMWFYQGKLKHNTEKGAAIIDVAPGKQNATLTLASGKKIRLSDAVNGELAKEAGVVITKSADGQLMYEVLPQSDAAADKINVLTTGNGETYKVRLPDGSAVWLNAASSLTYPASFAKLKDRRVKLFGEGYFEITKNMAQPFVVVTSKQEVTVLGTHFNINAYGDEKAVRTTLLEGSVKVAALEAAGSPGRTAAKVLKPGQESVLDAEGIQVREVDVDEAMAWQKGYFSFYNEDITSIMRKVSRWYNIEVEYSGQLPQNGFDARINKYSSITQVLEKLEKTGDVHFRIERRKVIVSK